MSIQLEIEQMPGYLAARFIGVAVPGEGSQQFESIAERCKRTKNNKLLIDLIAFDAENYFMRGFSIVAIFVRLPANSPAPLSRHPSYRRDKLSRFAASSELFEGHYPCGIRRFIGRWTHGAYVARAVLLITTTKQLEGVRLL